MTDRGHNNPPEMIDLARETTSQISQWFAEHPAVSSEQEARDIKLHIDRAKLCIRDLEDDRDRQVRPLNERVAAINGANRQVKRPLEAVLDSMLGALDAFIKAEETKRIKAALEAQERAALAAEVAREAEKLEREQVENAQMGEVGIDIAAAAKEADAAFNDYVVAERAAIRAKEDVKIRIGGGIGRAIGLREKETLHVEDAVAAITEIGLVENIRLAILTAARAFRKLHDRLPNGVSSTIDRNVR